MPTKLHLSVDASSLSRSGCLLNWKRTVVDGYREPRSSAAVVYGSAVHKFIDTMFKTSGDWVQARNACMETFNVPKIDNRKSTYLSDANHMFTTCQNVWLRIIMSEKDFDILKTPAGEPATEQTFSIPFYEDDTITVDLSGLSTSEYYPSEEDIPYSYFHSGT